MDKPINEVERLAEAVVFFDPESSSACDDILVVFTPIQTWLQNQGAETLSQLLLQYHAAIKAGRITKVLPALEVVVSSLQTFIRDGRPQEELEWPSPEEADASNKRPDIELPENVDRELFDEYLKIQPAVLDEIDQFLLILEKAEDAEVLANLLRKLHTLKGESGLMGLHEVEHICHRTEDVLEEVAVACEPDFYFAVLDWLRSVICFYRGEKEAPQPFDFEEVVPLARTELKNRAENDADVAEMNDAGADDYAEDTEAPEAPKIKSNPTQSIVKDSLHIDANRVDLLVDAIGELVVAESMVTQSDEIKNWASSTLKSHLDQIAKITRELQFLGMGMRMIPIRGAFQKMARLVRDLSKKNNKAISFIMQGEDTEIDKQVVDQIGDPLVHLVRNAIDHGIESSEEERTAAGKVAVASVTLRAFHRGGTVIIEIEDDGRGLNAELILQKALEKGLIDEGEELSEKEIFELIFNPGFSTAQKVSDISGRGVGMDVVRQSITKLRGTIDIKSQPGVGSTFIITLPLTLAIIDGLVVRSSHEKYIIPTLSVLNSLRPNPEELYSIAGKGVVLKFQDELIPVHRLSTLFNLDMSSGNEESIVVILEEEGRKMGIIVEELVGKQQVVIKNLGQQFDPVGISGGAIMSDGTVGLILDISALVKKELG